MIGDRPGPRLPAHGTVFEPASNSETGGAERMLRGGAGTAVSTNGGGEILAEVVGSGMEAVAGATTLAMGADGVKADVLACAMAGSSGKSEAANTSSLELQ